MELEIKFTSRSNKVYEFNSTEHFILFINEQLKYWDVFITEFDLSGINNQPISSSKCLSALLSEVKSLEESLNNETTQEQSKKTIISNFLNSLRSKLSYWLHSEDLLTAPYIDCFRKFGSNASMHFIGYATETEGVPKQITKDTLNAYIFFYEFKNSNINYLSRLESEKKSIQETLQNLRLNCDEVESAFNEQLTNVKLLKNSSSDEFKDLYYKNATEHDSKLTEFTTEFDSFIDNSTRRVNDLENLYQEKLRLAKPAEYWKKSAEKYAKQGYTFMAILVLWIVCGFVYVSSFFNSWLQGESHHLNLTTLEGAVIFGTAITIYTLLAKTISKLTFSSMHLMRDSEEREQLTYLYLALTKESELDKTSREGANKFLI